MRETPIAAVIWDMDGLLLDTERLSHASWMAAAAELGVDADPNHFLRIIGMNRAGIEASLLESFGPGADLAELARVATRIYNERIEGGPPIKPGAREAIALLAERRFPQAVVTSSKRHVAERKLGHHDLLRHLSAMVAGDEVEFGKPHPEPFERAAQLLEVEPSACIVFEDSINGVLGASRAGMRPILVPDLVEHPPESMKLLWRHYKSLLDALPLLREISDTRSSQQG